MTVSSSIVRIHPRLPCQSMVLTMLLIVAGHGEQAPCETGEETDGMDEGSYLNTSSKSNAEFLFG